MRISSRVMAEQYVVADSTKEQYVYNLFAYNDLLSLMHGTYYSGSLAA